MLAWIGTVCGILGSVLVALNSGFQFVGYTSFLIGSIACLITAWKVKDKANMVLWGFFFVVNIMGIINYV